MNIGKIFSEALPSIKKTGDNLLTAATDASTTPISSAATQLSEKNIKTASQAATAYGQVIVNDSTGLLAKLDLIKHRIFDSAIQPKNFLGQGGNHKVYNIPGLDDYVLRIPHEGAIPGEISEISNILPGRNFGQPVAKVGNCQILIKQKGIPAGVPYGDIRRAKGPEAIRIYKEHLNRAASMDQETYDELAQDMILLNKHKIRVDSSKSNNLLVDPPNQELSYKGRFNLIDIADLQWGKSHNGLQDMAAMLLDTPFASNVMDPDSIRLRGIIMNKSLKAAQKTGLPIPRESSSLEFAFRLGGLE